MRAARREGAQPARRRRSDGELRDRASVRRVRPRPRRDRRPRCGGRSGRVPRLAASRRGHDGAGRRRATGAAAPAPVRLGRPFASGAHARHGSRPAVRRMAVGEPRAGDPRRALGRLAVPPEGLDEPATPSSDDGHPHLDRDARCVGLVGRRPALPRRGRHRRVDGLRARARPRRRHGCSLLRGRGRRDDARSRRAIPRGESEAPGRCRPACPRRARREAGQRDRRRRDRAQRPDRRARRRDDLRRSAGREDRDRRRRGRGHAPRSTGRC